MRVSGGRNAVWICLASLMAAPTTALPCGFEDPNSATAARGILNWAFPDALHVTSAVWSAQLRGIIAREEVVSAPATALLGYQKVAMRLGAFRNGLSSTLDGRGMPAFSMVLIGPMLWTRFELIGTTVNMTLHAAGPLGGDVVIVTDEPVVAAMNAGRITSQAARELGLLRLYGAPDAVQHTMSWLDRPSPRTSSGASSAGN